MNDYEQKPSGENVVLRSVYVHTILYHDHQEHRPSGKCSCTRQRIRDKVLVPGVDATAQDEPALECEHIASLKMYTESDLALAVDHEPVCHLPGRRVSVSPACDVENVGIVTLPTAQDSSRIRCGCRDAKDKSTDLTIRGRHVEALRKANLSQLCCVHLDAVMVYLEEHRLQQLLYPKADSINAKDLYLDIRTGKFQESDQESPNHRYTPVLDEPLLLKKRSGEASESYFRLQDLIARTALATDVKPHSTGHPREDQCLAELVLPPVPLQCSCDSPSLQNHGPEILSMVYSLQSAPLLCRIQDERCASCGKHTNIFEEYALWPADKDARVAFCEQIFYDIFRSLIAKSSITVSTQAARLESAARRLPPNLSLHRHLNDAFSSWVKATVTVKIGCSICGG